MRGAMKFEETRQGGKHHDDNNAYWQMSANKRPGSDLNVVIGFVSTQKKM